MEQRFPALIVIPMCIFDLLAVGRTKKLTFKMKWSFSTILKSKLGGGLDEMGYQSLCFCTKVILWVSNFEVAAIFKVNFHCEVHLIFYGPFSFKEVTNWNVKKYFIFSPSAKILTTWPSLSPSIPIFHIFSDKFLVLWRSFTQWPTI